MNAPGWHGRRSDFLALHAAALAAADPEAAVLRHLAPAPEGMKVGGELVPFGDSARLWLVAAGKASLGMSRAAIRVLGERIEGGVVAHPAAAPEPAGSGPEWPAAIRRIPAGHPLPDGGSLAAGAAVERLLANAGSGDAVLLLLSGGASALFESLLPGVELESLRALTLALQRAGADIAELNAVRRCLSRLKGGGLARYAAPARVVTLALSDVLGDRPEDIGSGPTVPSPTGGEEALGVIERRGVAGAAPECVAALRAAVGQRRLDGPPGLFHVVASNRLAAEAVATTATGLGFRSLVLSTHLQGEASEAGKVIAGCAKSLLTDRIPVAPPACLVFGGETTVTVRGAGRGGRNQELALGAALALDGCPKAAVFSFATDGVDGPTAAAGAIATGETVARARALGFDIRRALADNDSEPFFRALGDLWESGPTGTNVNDLAIVLAYP